MASTLASSFMLPNGSDVQLQAASLYSKRHAGPPQGFCAWCAGQLCSATDTFVGVEEEYEYEYGYELRGVAPLAIWRGAAANNNNSRSASNDGSPNGHRTTPTPTHYITTCTSPLPAPQHHHHRAPPAHRAQARADVHHARGPPRRLGRVAPLEEFIVESIDPHQAARNRGGRVFTVEFARDLAGVEKGARVLVAIKSVALIPDYVAEEADEEGGVEQKLVDVRRELEELRVPRCIPADMEEGPRLQVPRIIARFASDMLQALVSLQKHRIAHRDLRSDKLLLNGEGVFRKSSASIPSLSPF
ncbi:hypothetical protein C8J57DRAFT_1716190 [Mycena rebaudengoi]|nr:hypothetical protein C8J57DRAFT_1716190 [Mycena rebaudengoi]